MSERAFAWRGLAPAGQAAAVLGGLLAAAIGSPAEAQILGTACSSPSATVAASATILGNATPRLTSICTGGTWQLLPHQVSNTTLSCENATKGLLRYNGTSLQLCNEGAFGPEWTSLGGTPTLGLDDLTDVTTTTAGLASIYAGFEAGGAGTATVTNSTAFGYRALGSNSVGSNNTAFGTWAARYTTTGYHNTAIGRSALNDNTSGHLNTAVGSGAAEHNTSGKHNTAVGQGSLNNNLNGEANVAIGYLSSNGAANAVITNTITIGRSAGYSLTSSTGNILIGHQAGDAITSGNYNIVIGYDADPVANTGSNQLNIGNTIYGDLGTKRIGIGTNTPAYPLVVSGSTVIAAEDSTIYTTSGAGTDPQGVATPFIQAMNYSNVDGSAAYLRLTATDSGGRNDAAWIGAVSVSGTASYSPHLIFGMRTGNSSHAERMRLDNSGRLGIGTTDPSTSLHVNGSITLSTNGELYKAMYYDGSNWRYASTGQPGFAIRKSATNITEFRVAPDGTAGNIPTTIPSIALDGATGNVGIQTNTVAPSGTLHVSGTVFLRRYGAAPTTCNSGVNGLLALTSAAKMCVCDGTSWKDVGSNYGACSW